MTSRSDRQDRIAGVLTGAAVGDALGTGYETGLPVPRSGATMCGGGYGFKPGEFSDDTQMAVCVAVAGGDLYQVAALFLAWFGGHPKDIGNCTRAVLSSVRPAGDVLGQMQAASRRYARQQAAMHRPRGWDMGGANGSLMRTGPACLPFLGDRRQVAKAARELSDLTHGDPWSGDSCVLWSLAIEAAVASGELGDIGDGLALIPAKRRPYWADQIAAARRYVPQTFRSNGGSVGAFRAALSAVTCADSLEDGLQTAVAIGGDTDTVAAIAGSLLGAVHGASAIPAKWLEDVWGCGPDGIVNAAGLEQLALQAAGELR
jgi:ADP-ribosylglycohydrolase